MRTRAAVWGKPKPTRQVARTATRSLVKNTDRSAFTSAVVPSGGDHPLGGQAGHRQLKECVGQVPPNRGSLCVSPGTPAF
jgi:hypothetical protein